MSNFEDNWHDQRPARSVLYDKAFQVLADLLFDHAVVSPLFVARCLQRIHHGQSRLVEESVLIGVGREAPHHDLRWGFDFACEFVDRNDGQHNAVLAQVTAIADHQVFHDVAHRVGIYTDASDGYAPGFLRTQFIEFEDVAAFGHQDFSDRAVHRSRKLSVQLELPVLTVNWDEVLWLHQVDDQLQLFLAGVTADVDWRRRAVVVDDVGVAAEKMVNDAIDRLLITWNNARRQDYGVTFLNTRKLVIVHRRARQRRHGLALGAADQDADFLRRKIANLRRMNQRTVWNVDVAKVLGDFSRLHHRAPDQRYLAPVFEGLFYRQLDAMDRRGEARDEQPSFGARKYFFKSRTHGAFARRVAAALDIG